MLQKNKVRFAFLLISIFVAESAFAQSFLPPAISWHGKSESFIAQSNNPWITPTEISGFVTTPNYEETITWFKKLTDATPLLTMVSIGKSVEGRDISMIIASTEKI